ncbi:MAG: hypothetical protein WBB65_00940 [Anaerolineales bacterium]
MNVLNESKGRINNRSLVFIALLFVWGAAVWLIDLANPPPGFPRLAAA